MIRLPLRLGGWVVVAALCLAAAPSQGQELKFLRIGTGSTAGTYFPIGSLIASVISNPPGSRTCEDGGSCGVPGLIAAAQATEGSVANIRAIAEGRLDSGLAQADVVHWAYHAEGIFQGKPPLESLRAVANLFPESIHLISRAGLPINGVADLKRHRVSIDVPGSGTRVDATLILNAYGLGDDDFLQVYVGPNTAIDLMLEKRLDAFFFVGGYPASGITRLAKAMGIDLVPISGPEARALSLRYKFFAEDVIPAGTYAGVDAVETLSVGAQWVVGAAADEALVHGITKALWHPNNRQLLDTGHPKARLIRPELALAGISIPLHPGAERYYREAGLTR